MVDRLHQLADGSFDEFCSCNIYKMGQGETTAESQDQGRWSICLLVRDGGDRSGGITTGLRTIRANGSLPRSRRHGSNRKQHVSLHLPRPTI